MTFPKDIEDRLLHYRKSRKSDTGKLMFRETAIIELMRMALTDFQPPKPVEERLNDIERRLHELEKKNAGPTKAPVTRPATTE